MSDCVTGITAPFKLNLHSLFSNLVITYLCHVNKHVTHFQQFLKMFLYIYVQF